MSFYCIYIRQAIYIKEMLEDLPEDVPENLPEDAPEDAPKGRAGRGDSMCREDVKVSSPSAAWTHPQIRQQSRMSPFMR